MCHGREGQVPSDVIDRREHRELLLAEHADDLEGIEHLRYFIDGGEWTALDVGGKSWNHSGPGRQAYVASILDDFDLAECQREGWFIIDRSDIDRKGLRS